MTDGTVAQSAPPGWYRTRAQSQGWCWWDGCAWVGQAITPRRLSGPFEGAPKPPPDFTKTRLARDLVAGSYKWRAVNCAAGIAAVDLLTWQAGGWAFVLAVFVLIVSVIPVARLNGGNLARQQRGCYSFPPFDPSELYQWEVEPKTGSILRLPGWTPQQIGVTVSPPQPPALLTGISAYRWRIVVQVAEAVGAAGFALTFGAGWAARAGGSPMLTAAGIAGSILSVGVPIGLVCAQLFVRRRQKESRCGYATVESFDALRYWLLDAKTGAVLREPGQDRLDRTAVRRTRRSVENDAHR